MFLNIITPTIGRQSLFKLCETLDSQTFQDWKHIIYFDKIADDFDLKDFVRKYSDDRRLLIFNKGEPYNDMGNTPRIFSDSYVDKSRTSCYIQFMDDDDYYNDSDCLQDIANFTKDSNYPKFIVFPSWRVSFMFFNKPCGHSMTHNNQFIYSTKIDEKYGHDGYCADGELIERLKLKAEPVYFDRERPVTVVPKISRGE